MNYKIAIAMIALPVGAISLLPNSASAAELRFSPEASQPSVITAQRYDDRRDLDQREKARREELRRQELRREELRRESIRREAPKRVWIPGHWELGLLGIGRKWVEGHWETR